MRSHPVIRTPDQRVRVFVSSTLGEMAPERAAVRAAVERLRLVPVMFETGARPHPPRELYRAYLAQSHIFVGIYWERYGWVAPGESVSGLEDEYRLAGHRPRLLYIKEPAPRREERLGTLIQDFRDQDAASYKRFGDPDQLGQLIADDLSLLMAERFEAGELAGGPGGEPAAGGPAVPVAGPPRPLTPTEGRDADIGQVADLVRGQERLVTVTGPGGVGKTRVALEAAQVLRDRFPGEIHFVPLATVRDPGLALRTMAEQVGARTEGTRPVRDALAEWFGTDPCLLLLDNLEQVVALGPELAELLGRAAGVQVLATSRQVLRVRGEREVPLPPLPLPRSSTLPEAATEPAVRLFVERATAAAPGFQLTSGNVGAVAELCRRLDGLPLAIELAAARTRLLPPARLLERLSRDSRVLASAGADAPARQRTLRDTLEWSYRLLSPPEQAVFAWLSVFAGGFTLEAAEAVCTAGGAGGPPEPDLLETIASLLDKSLLVVDHTGTDEPRLRMLETVRGYAAERLDERGETTRLRQAHLGYFHELSDRAQPYLCGPGQWEWAQRFDAERANLRAAVATALAAGDDTAVIDLIWDVYVYYWVRDAVDEPESWMQAVSSAGRPLDPVQTARLHCLQTLTRISRGDYHQAREQLASALALFRERGMAFEAAVALKEVANVAYGLDRDPQQAAAALRESSALFESIGHDWGVALIETMLGSVLAMSGDLAGAESHHQRSLERARQIDNEPIMVQALNQLALTRVLAGRPQEAVGFLAEAVPLVLRGNLQTAATYCLETIAAVAVERDDPATAAEALAVAGEVRRRLRTPIWPIVEEFVDGLSRRVTAAPGSPGGYQPGGPEPDRSPDGDPFAVLSRGLAAVG